jgi:hypothetical protein
VGVFLVLARSVGVKHLISSFFEEIKLPERSEVDALRKALDTVPDEIDDWKSLLKEASCKGYSSVVETLIDRGFNTYEGARRP